MIQKEYWCLIWNMNMQSASSIWSNLLNYYQMPRSISSKLFVIASGEANVYGSSYFWNFRTSSFKQVAFLILEMVNCLNTIILKSFVIIVFTSILHLFYRTNATQNMYDTYFFINRILDPITSDVMYNVTLSTWQYASNTRN